MKSRVQILGLIAMLILLGCGQLYSSSMIKKEYKQLSGIKFLVNNTSAKVVVSIGDKEEAIIETEEQNISKVLLNHIGNKLIIDIDANYFYTKHFVIYLTLKELKGVKIKGSGDFLLTGQIRSSDFTLIIEGSGDANIANIQSDKVTIALFGSGDLIVGGESRVFNAEISGSGDINAIKVKCKEANVKINGSGDCSIDPSESLYVKISGSGDVLIKNEPKTIKTSIAGSGDIRRY
jgi:hypothetical protein